MTRRKNVLQSLSSTQLFAAVHMHVTRMYSALLFKDNKNYAGTVEVKGIIVEYDLDVPFSLFLLALLLIFMLNWDVVLIMIYGRWLLLSTVVDLQLI